MKSESPVLRRTLTCDVSFYTTSFPRRVDGTFEKDELVVQLDSGCTRNSHEFRVFMRGPIVVGVIYFRADQLRQRWEEVPVPIPDVGMSER